MSGKFKAPNPVPPGKEFLISITAVVNLLTRRRISDVGLKEKEPSQVGLSERRMRV
jgi:hypothetical protein